MSVPTPYAATRITRDSPNGFAQTRTRFDQQVPSVDPAVTLELVVSEASWEKVRTTVESLAPGGLVALARIDQGALLSLSGHPLEATLYLVGNPLVALQLIELQPAAALYAPFRVAIYHDPTGVHASYDLPSSVFKSLGSSAVDEIAVGLDEKIRTAVEETCR